MDIRRTSLVAKLGRVVALQVVLLSASVALGIYITNTIVQDFLIREALFAEAEHFWQLYDQDSSQSLPNTANMQGYLSLSDEYAPPPQLRDYPAGFIGRVTIDEQPLTLFVSAYDDASVIDVQESSANKQAHLYLLFASDDVSQLAFYFGILPLSIALLLVYGMSFLTYRLSHRAISPIVRLAEYFAEFRFGRFSQPAVDLGELRVLANAEVDVMIDAIDSFAERLDTFIERERIFTRDASHELRTPIAVFKGSLDLLQRRQDRSEDDLKAFARMRRTVEDMEGLIETLLLLARGEELGKSGQLISVNDLIPGLFDQFSTMAEQRGIELKDSHQHQLKVEAPPRVVQILLANLLRNAISYTHQGYVEVRVGRIGVSVIDTGIGMNTSELQHAFEPFYRSDRGRASGSGHGLGLSIVRRLVHQFGWQVSVQSDVGEGTRVNIDFFDQGD